MKVAVFYPESLYSAWSVSEGLADELKRGGHEVIAAPIKPETTQLSRKAFPSREELESCDRVIVSGPEHLGKFLSALYPDWQQFKVKKVAYLHETIEREDYGKLPIDQLKRIGDILFSPAAQDEDHGLKWLPFGVDTTMFDCKFVHWDRLHDSMFIGLMYPKRVEFLQKSGLALPCMTLQVAGDVRKSAELYARELCHIRVLVNLPSLCQHLVTKVFEAMACGCAVVTPHMGNRNFELFENGKNIQYYDNNPKGIIDGLLDNPEYALKMARAGYEEVKARHDLKFRVEALLAA